MQVITDHLEVTALTQTQLHPSHLMAAPHGPHKVEEEVHRPHLHHLETEVRGQTGVPPGPLMVTFSRGHH